ncbi:hypothetical protein ACIRPT_39825 [Streptomyces sp. NPDC101227]|uniref:hypothetical protein n=1 Tax=Streptomyces sp. NPDC101227 TaxID=3366136 RepID=UPI00382C598C
MVTLRQLTTDDIQALTRIYSGASVRHTTGQIEVLPQSEPTVDLIARETGPASTAPVTRARAAGLGW